MMNIELTDNLSAVLASPSMSALAGILLLLILALIGNFAVKKALLRLIRKFLNMVLADPAIDTANGTVVSRLANVVPALIILAGIPFVPEMPVVITAVIRNVTVAFIILSVARTFGAALDVANLLYLRRPDAHNKPIKGYIQVLKIAIFLIAAILIIAALIDKSPVILLSGLGAMTAVLMLVFQDTLLSLVASVQITSGDMARVGDWIEMPQLNADGDVIDISLHTVKVQNWDKTITTLPTRRLISDPFKNWRGMTESGGRRIKRALYIDTGSIHFLSPEERRHLDRFRLLRDYLAAKDADITDWNDSLAENEKDAVNTRRITNIGTFRAYVEKYLRCHPHIHQDMTLLVRQLNPGPDGLPLEIYCFTNTTAWAAYESIQSDIFDHLYAILPEFGLRVFQNPGGHDLQQAIAHRSFRMQV